jgi:hypothetical protein
VITSLELLLRVVVVLYTWVTVPECGDDLFRAPSLTFANNRYRGGFNSWRPGARGSRAATAKLYVAGVLQPRCRSGVWHLVDVSVGDDCSLECRFISTAIFKATARSETMCAQVHFFKTLRWHLLRPGLIQLECRTRARPTDCHQSK